MNCPLVVKNGKVAKSREELQKALCRYKLKTKNLIDTVTTFINGLSKWRKERKKEMTDMKDIKSRPNKSLWGRFRLNSQRLEEELAVVLESTQKGLAKLTYFLEAMEELAVTSLYIFEESDQVMEVSTGMNLEAVQAAITAARLACPILLLFKRDHKAFFHPSLDNVEVMRFQLDKYIRITKKMSMIFKGVTENFISGFWQNNQDKTALLSAELSEDDIQSLLSHINQLDGIRMDKDFRLVFLLQNVSTSDFIDEFSQRKPKMMQFLEQLEGNAVQLDKMKKGSLISSVAGSSVRAVGGVLSIVGLALTPVTAGVSLALTMAGVGLGLTSAVNGVVTTGAEFYVNCKENKKANEVFQNFMEDVKSLQDYLEVVSSQPDTKVGEDGSEMAMASAKVVKGLRNVSKKIYSIIDTASDFKVAAQEGKAISNISRAASDIPDMGQAAARGSLVMTKSLYRFTLSLGLDVFFICKDSVNLAQGSKSDHSQLLRSRSALWRSEVDSMQKIHDSLCKGVQESDKKRCILEMPFEPMKKSI